MADEPPSVWRVSRSMWNRAAAASRQHRRERLLKLKEIVDGLIDALGRLEAINAAVRNSTSRVDARTAIMAFGYTPIQTEHILDTPVSRQTQEAREQLRAQRSELEASLAQLDRE